MTTASSRDKGVTDAARAAGDTIRRAREKRGLIAGLPPALGRGRPRLRRIPERG